MSSSQLIQRILASSGIARSSRRRDVEEELRTHIEDLADEARAAGRAGAAVEEFIAERFGTAEQVGPGFAEVYRCERIAVYASSFALLASLCLIAVFALIYSAQFLSSLGLGVPAAQSMRPGHVRSESLLLAALTLGYLGLRFAEMLFAKARFGKAILLVFLVFAICSVGLQVVAQIGPAMLIAGFVSATSVRVIEKLSAGAVIRFIGVAAFFCLAGLSMMPCSRQGHPGAWMIMLPVCMAAALSCQIIFAGAAIFDRRVARRNIA